MKCANCDSPALWVYEPAGSDSLPFCDKHLPRFLRAAAKSGSLTKTDHYDEVHSKVAAMLAPDEFPIPQPMTAEAPAPEFADPEEYLDQEDVPKPKRVRKKAEPVAETDED